MFVRLVFVQLYALFSLSFFLLGPTWFIAFTNLLLFCLFVLLHFITNRYENFVLFFSYFFLSYTRVQHWRVDVSDRFSFYVNVHNTRALHVTFVFCFLRVVEERKKKIIYICCCWLLVFAAFVISSAVITLNRGLKLDRYLYRHLRRMNTEKQF